MKTHGLKLVFLLFTALLVADAFAEDDESMFGFSLKGLRNMDKNLEAIADEGVANWALNKVSEASDDAARSTRSFIYDAIGQVDGLGDVGKSAEKAERAGRHVFDIGGSSLEKAEQAWAAGDLSIIDEHLEYVRRDKLPQLMADAVPDSLRKAAKDAHTLYKDFTWADERGHMDQIPADVNQVFENSIEGLQETVENAAEMMGVDLQPARDLIGDYFSEDASYGLEPGSEEAEQVNAFESEIIGEISMSDDLLAEVQEFVEEQPMEPESSIWTDYFEEQEELRLAEVESAQQAAYKAAKNEPESYHDNPFAEDIARLEQDLGFSTGANDFSDDIERLGQEFGGDFDSNVPVDWAMEANRTESAIDDWEEGQRRLEEERRRLAALRRQQQQQQRARDAELAAARAQVNSARAAYEDAEDACSQSSSGGFFGSVLKTAAEVHLAKEYGVAPGWTDPCGSSGSSALAQAIVDSERQVAAIENRMRQMPARPSSPSAGSSNSSFGTCAQAAQLLTQMMESTEGSSGGGICSTYTSLYTSAKQLLQHSSIRGCPSMRAQAESSMSQGASGMRGGCTEDHLRRHGL